MTTSPERVLNLEDDLEILDLIVKQVLSPLGSQVKIVKTFPMVIQKVISFEPDIVLEDLNMSGLSGKDLMVAISSQGLNTPMIIIARRVMDGDIIQAFRYSASDYLRWPIRESELVAAVQLSFHHKNPKIRKRPRSICRM